MADFTPRTVFPEYASNGTSIVFPLKNFNSLTPSLADADYGDAREIVRGVVETTYEYLSGLPEEAKPTNFSIERGDAEFSGDTLTISYTVSYTLGVRSNDLKLA
jgi:hypothetical protein